MTASSHRKMYRQLKSKPVKLQKYKKFNAPKKRTTGISLRPCRICGRLGGHVQAYGLHLCRQCFREYAKKIGFRKYR